MLRCYALRRLNPFLGVTQVAEGDGARALSVNGRVWEIQALGERPEHTWRSGFGAAPLVEQYFTFGLWDRVEGMSRVPANPLLNIGDMSRAAETLTDALAGRLADLPFPLHDRFECWSIDNTGAPVALLASTDREQHTACSHVEPWHATPLSDDRFVSPTLKAAGIPVNGEHGARHHAGYLERETRRRGTRKAWFERRADGSGRGLENNENLDNAAFPTLGLTGTWEAPTMAGAVADYTGWLAPRLLTLQHLDTETRRALELRAVRRASELAGQFALLPGVVEHDAVQAARVEADLRAAAQH